MEPKACHHIDHQHGNFGQDKEEQTYFKQKDDTVLPLFHNRESGVLGISPDTALAKGTASFITADMNFAFRTILHKLFLLLIDRCFMHIIIVGSQLHFKSKVRKLPEKGKEYPVFRVG